MVNIPMKKNVVKSSKYIIAILLFPIHTISIYTHTPIVIPTYKQSHYNNA